MMRIPVFTRLLPLLLAAAACGTRPDASDTSQGLSAPASGLPEATPAEVGMSAEALNQIAPAMQAYVDDGRLAGVMTMVARRGSVVH